ncbi:MAG: acetyl-CoA hydrolase/transferase C-terminal domain-containing protein [Martelella sp.]|uniref:acetyl-CoA hydrolase/transferase family protein n=1 Tax=Martelella sp. TaxID=1969699 RepID=UPI0032420C51
MSAELDLTRYLRPGDTIVWGQSHAEPTSLVVRLIEQRHALARLRLFLGIGLDDNLKPEHSDAFDFISYCGSGSNRALANAGVLDILPVHYSRLPDLMTSGQLRIDAVFLQVSPPDEKGRHSLSMAREYLLPAIKHARVVIGEIQPDAPWTFGGPYMTERDFTALVSSDAKMPESRLRSIGPVEDAIGRNIASLIEDGATLQVGIGNVPDAALMALSDRRDLGIHSGAIGEGVAMLSRAGVITNSRKAIDTGVSIGGVLMGGSVLRSFAHRNPAIKLRGSDYTHDPMVLGRIERLIAMNSAIEVDLTGQINSETANGRYLGAVGGILDFTRAAGASKGGVPIIALPSTGSGTSRIVPALSGPVTVPRSESCVIVTEHGIADLRGLSLSGRISRMIAVAHPDHREELERKSRG